MARRFTLSNLLLFTTVVAFAALAYSYHTKLREAEARVATLESELSNSRPIAFDDVAWQIITATQHVTKTNVHGIYYNSLRDRYQVQFGWEDPKTQKEWETAISFDPNGDGSYTGWLLTLPFAKEKISETGDTTTEPFYVTIKDDVRRHNDLLTKHGYDPIKNPNWRTY